MNVHPKLSLIFSFTIMAAVGLLTALPSQAQVVVDEQFDGNAVDTSVFTFDNGSTIFGRVRLNSQAPPVQNGTLRLRLQSFNPINTGDLFLADEVRTIRTFAPTQACGFSFETRARFVDDANNPLSPGVIGGAFLFGLDANFPNPNERDEIDFELLSNNPFGEITTNIFNDQGFNSAGDFVTTDVPGLDLTEFNDYRIEIQIDSTRFFVNDQLIRQATTNLALEPQDFRLNINAQGPEFAAAFSPLIQPTANPNANEINIFEVDSLLITQLPANETTVLADFTTTNTGFRFASFENLGTFSNEGFTITKGEMNSDNGNFGGIIEAGGNLITEGFFVDQNTQLLIEATVGELNDTDFVVAVREDSDEFFSVAVPASDLADDGQAVVNLSDFFFNDGGDGVISGSVIEVSFQTPFGPSNAFDFTVQRISVLNTPAPPVLLGDVNLDGVVDFFDISPFIAILSANGFQAEADIDQNEVVDFFDISPFIAILSAQSGQ